MGSLIDVNTQPASSSSGNSFVSEAGGLNLGQAKLDTVLPIARHRCQISSEGEGAVLPGRNDTEMGLAKSLRASA